MIRLLLRQSPPAKKEYFMSILSSPAFSGSSPAAAPSLTPQPREHPARGRKKAALPLILFRVFAVLFLFCGTLPASALEGQCLDHSTWKLTDGTLTISGRAVFLEDKSCAWREHPFSSLVINEGITGIDDSFFSDFQNLESVSIPASIEKIHYRAFKNCHNLKSVTIAEDSRLKTIGSSAFADCIQLRSLTIGRNSELQTIEDSVFHDCFLLRSLTIPASVTKIGANAFFSCLNLNLTIERGNEPLIFENGVFGGTGNIWADLVYTGNDPGYFEITQEKGFSISGNRLMCEDVSEDAVLTWVSQPDVVPGPEPETPEFFPVFCPISCPGCRLPATGFSSRRPAVLSVQPKDVRYEPVEMRLQIPSLNVETELVTVPLKDNSWQVEWLSGRAGILDGTALPGEGYSVIAAHNTLNDTEYGPFALLGTLETDDLVTVADEGGSLKLFRVYANELLAPDDMETMAAVARQEENALVLVTCENESEEGGYLDRRAIFAKPIG